MILAQLELDLPLAAVVNASVTGLRDAMGLRSIALLAVPVMVWISPAQAGPREDSLAVAARCASYLDDRQWLECYYGAVQPMRARLGLAAASTAQQNLANSAAGSSTNFSAPRTSATTSQAAVATNFGFPEKEPDAELRGLTALMASYQISPVTSMFVVTLNNGQTWAQVDGDGTYAHWMGPAGQMAVTITPGRIGGGYVLRIKGRVGAYRVHRVS